MAATVEPCCGGLSVKDADGWSVAAVIQRDPHPVHGGGISREECEARARVITDRLIEHWRDADLQDRINRARWPKE